MKMMITMPEIKMYYKAAWLTLNRACNLQCPWCYAKNAHANSSLNMDLELAKNLIDFITKLGIKSIRLIGGEPTIYPHLIEVLQEIRQKNAVSILVSNGIELQNEDFCQKLFENGLSQASISIKGNAEVYSKLSKKNQFQSCLNAITVLRRFQKRVTATFVISLENVYQLPDLIALAKNAGATNFGLSFIYEFNCNGEATNNNDASVPRKIIKAFMDIYDKINEISDGNFSLQNTYPLCLWNKHDYEILNKKNQISTVCQLLTRSGIIFDTDGTIIPCNAMHEVKLLKFGFDFSTTNELYEKLKNENIQDIYKKLLGAPDNDCSSCQQWKDCGGGCVATYSKYCLKDLLKSDN